MKDNWLLEILQGKPSRTEINEENVAGSDVIGALAEWAKEMKRLEETMARRHATDSVKAWERLDELVQMLGFRTKAIRHEVIHGKPYDKDEADRRRRRAADRLRKGAAGKAGAEERGAAAAEQ